MCKITLASGFTFDATNLYGKDKVTAADIAEFAPKRHTAHQAVDQIRQTGIAKDHVSKDGVSEAVLFTELPYVTAGNLNSPAVMEKLTALQDSVRNRIDMVVSFGIGGSYLGAKVLFDYQCGEFWNTKTVEERQGYPKVFFSGQNLDGRRTADLIHYIKSEAASVPAGSYRVLLLVISKSGSTTEPMSTFMVVKDALARAGITVEVIAVTDPKSGDGETLLHKLATTEGWPMFSVPDGVGGRFSVFCEVGLVLGAIIGFDIRAFLQGAKEMDETCQNEDIWQNPAMLNSVLKYIGSAKYGRNIEVFMPYGDYFKSLSEWYVQLLAESLGKRYDRQGEVVHYGRTPLVAVGCTDMHAQTQEHQEGRLNKIVQFVSVKKNGVAIAVPNLYPEYNCLASFAGLELADLLEMTRIANGEALISEGRFNANFILPEANAYHLGELMYMLCLSIVYEGEFANVDAFNQPGVEIYKNIMSEHLKKLQKTR